MKEWATTPGDICGAAVGGIFAATCLRIALARAREEVAKERAAREKAQTFREGHPGMCCGQCHDMIAAAEARAVQAEQTAHEERAHANEWLTQLHDAKKAQTRVERDRDDSEESSRRAEEPFCNRWHEQRNDDARAVLERK